jgi:hypothetical protein
MERNRLACFEEDWVRFNPSVFGQNLRNSPHNNNNNNNNNNKSETGTLLFPFWISMRLILHSKSFFTMLAFSKNIFKTNITEKKLLK